MINKKQHDEIDHLIAAYMSASDDEKTAARLKQLAAESEECRKYIQGQLEIWFAAGALADKSKFDAEQAFLRFMKRTGIHADTGKMPKMRIIRRRIAITAAVILLAILPLGGYWLGKTGVQRQFADITVETAGGSPMSMVLPDGTKAWLNAGSKIVYSQGFGVSDRCMKVTGEVCLDVAQNKALPFEIKSGQISLKVLGTKFTFSNYPDDENITVDLIRGKVALTDITSGQQMTLRPDERMTYKRSTGKMIRSSIDAQLSDSWIRDELFFDELPLKKVAQILSRRYGIGVKVAEHLQEKTFYGSFDTSEISIEQVLETMAKTKELNYKYENGQYVLY